MVFLLFVTEYCIHVPSLEATLWFLLSWLSILTTPSSFSHINVPPFQNCTWSHSPSAGLRPLVEVEQALNIISANSMNTKNIHIFFIVTSPFNKISIRFWKSIVAYRAAGNVVWGHRRYHVDTYYTVRSILYRPSNIFRYTRSSQS